MGALLARRLTRPPRPPRTTTRPAVRPPAAAAGLVVTLDTDST